MGTHNETNGAEPQNEFLSGFMIKNRAIPKNDETRQINNDKRAENTGKDSAERKSGTDFVQKLKVKLFQKSSESESKRQKVMVVMIPILFIVMVFMFRQVLSKPPQTTEAVTDENNPVAAVKTSSGSDIDWTIPDPLPRKIKNPDTVRQDTPDGPGNEIFPGNTENEVLSVKSILFSPDNPSVVIGNKIIYLNQKIYDAVVVEIHQDYIVLEKDGKRWTQKVAEEIIPEKQGEDIH